MPAKTLLSHFPLTRPHCGSTLCNGLQGLLVWGEKMLRLTVARAGFWDHRGGQVMLPTTTFATVHSRLEADDEPSLRALYPDAPPVNGIATSPQQYGGGRLELAFPDAQLPRATRPGQKLDGLLDLPPRDVGIWTDPSLESSPLPASPCRRKVTLSPPASADGARTGG